MFTGIVDHVGIITTIKKTKESLGLHISCQFNDLQLGESIAVDGICLTVTQFGPGYFECDLSPETCNVTTALHFQTGKQVNLERALRLSDRLGGHIVQGHVDQTASLVERSYEGDCLKLVFTGIVDTMSRLLIQKGSIAIDGVSLTINKIVPSGFEVMLIPHTLQRTNLEKLNVGDLVNIEYDWLAKLVSQQLQPYIKT
jgi:riboflavin synthase